MPFFSEDWIQELLAKVNIVDVIGEYVTLQNKSGKWWACCPFHNEKTPSFSINQEKGFFHCFGCGKGGNVIHFVMEQEKMTFPEACAYLAEKVKMPIPENTDNADYEKRKKTRERIIEMNKIAAMYFHKQLFSPQGKEALEYLKNRDINESIIKTFGIGFAPDGWDHIVLLLQEKGYTKQEMQQGGLAKIKDSKCYDVFRNRVMMPIIDTFSNVIGFGGRVMDDAMPKYLNSPETAAFNKSRSLYNLNIVRKQKNVNSLLLVEGYMDVIALYLYGLPNCVATLGTALTQDQARLIKRYVNHVYISYDGDEAGKKATLRAIDILEKENIEVRILSIPNGNDPDEYLKLYKKDGFVKLMKNSLPSMDYKFGVIAQKYDLSDEYQKEKFAKECVGLLKNVNSAIVKEKYVGKLSEITGFSVNSISQDTGTETKKENTIWKKPIQTEQHQKPDDKAENCMICLLCTYPQSIAKIQQEIVEDDFENNTNKKVFAYILQRVKKGFSPTYAEILSLLDNSDEIQHITAVLSDESIVGNNADSFLVDCANRVRLRNCLKEKNNLTQKCESIEENQEKNTIIEQIVDLDKEIQRLKTNF
ncbi:MAG: DNA primase [Christensenellaceae bacterium]